ncbi:MAG TPA: hypothetical protein VFB79_04380 [Candidatus Angelobacter sp.]|nr:hypothetical protein [Candidatus Angelobacter sp.]
MEQARDAVSFFVVGPLKLFAGHTLGRGDPERIHFQPELLARRGMRQGRCALVWTIFTVFVVLWMLGLALQFGAGVLPLLLVVGTVFLLMKQILQNKSFI